MSERERTFSVPKLAKAVSKSFLSFQSKQEAPTELTGDQLEKVLGQNVSNFQKMSLASCIKELGSNAKKGLSTAEAQKRLQVHGPNELDKEPPRPMWKIFLDQFNDLLVILLIIACIISAILGEFAAAIAILVIITLNATLGVVMTARAGSALDALQSITVSTCTVMRDGVLCEDFNAANLVPGDVVVLPTGCQVPADCRLLESKKLKIDESALTGESDPVVKKALEGAVEESKQDAIDEEKAGDKEEEKKLNFEHMVYMTCNCLEGNGMAIVVKTGMDTMIGEIQKLIQDADEKASPLEQKLSRLGEQLGLASIGISIVVFIAGVLRNERPDPKNEQSVYLQYLLIAVSLTVAAVPEGLPACVTITLAVGMQAMSKQNALIKNLYKVETLGSASVICTDKTGTLTANVQTAVKLWFGGALYRCTGVGYDPSGVVVDNDNKTMNDAELRASAVKATDAPAFAGLVAILACNAKTILQKETIHEKGGGSREQWTCTGNNTERPLVVAARKMGWNKEEIAEKFPNICENPFDSTRKMMSSLIHLQEPGAISGFGKADFVACVKGASNFVLQQCTHVAMPGPDGTVVQEPLTEKLLQHLGETVDELSSQALRVLAVAYKTFDDHPECDGPAELEHGLCLAGLFASIDPERPGIKDSIARCAQAGVRVCMITGDYVNTAKAIAVNVGLLGANPLAGKAVDCEGLRQLGTEESRLLDIVNWKVNQTKKDKKSGEDQGGGGCCRKRKKPSADASDPIELNDNVKVHGTNGGGAPSAEDVADAKRAVKVVQKKIDDITAFADVYARAKPVDKITIVRSFQRGGHVCAMTGDGVNDAPALRQANIGVAMGLAGTPVAKDASDMVLTDDNFCSIVSAIEQGRTIYANIGKFCYYLLSTNIAEVFAVLFCVIIGYPSPLGTVQILWLNLVTDGAPAVALAVELTEPSTMREGPRKQTENLIEKLMITGIAIQTVVLTVTVMLTYIYGVSTFTGSWLPGKGNLEALTMPAPTLADSFLGCESFACCDTTNTTISSSDYCQEVAATELLNDFNDATYQRALDTGRSMTIFVIVFAELLRAYTSRSLRSSIFTIGVFSNSWMQWSVGTAVVGTAVIFNIPGLREEFGAVLIEDGKLWAWIAIFSFIPVVADELTKWVYRKTGFGARPLWSVEKVDEEEEYDEDSKKKGDYESVRVQDSATEV